MLISRNLKDTLNIKTNGKHRKTYTFGDTHKLPPLDFLINELYHSKKECPKTPTPILERDTNECYNFIKSNTRTHSRNFNGSEFTHTKADDGLTPTIFDEKNEKLKSELMDGSTSTQSSGSE